MHWFLKVVVLICVMTFVSRLDNSVESVLIIIKPDGTSRKLQSIIYSLLESRLMINMERESIVDEAPLTKLERHYAEHTNRGFYPDLVRFMRSGPIAVSIWRGPQGTVNAVRSLVGSTDPQYAEDGTIRKLFGHSKQMNVIHASDSVKSANREILIWFGQT